MRAFLCGAVLDGYLGRCCTHRRGDCAAVELAWRLPCVWWRGGGVRSTLHEGGGLRLLLAVVFLAGGYDGHRTTTAADLADRSDLHGTRSGGPAVEVSGGASIRHRL